MFLTAFLPAVYGTSRYVFRSVVVIGGALFSVEGVDVYTRGIATGGGEGGVQLLSFSRCDNILGASEQMVL